MTREEAIRIIDPKTTCDALSEIEYFGGFSGEWARSIALCEALSMAAAALREREERENPKPLTLDELREMDGEPVWIRAKHYDKANGDEHFINGIESVLEFAERLPAADVAPVVHGRWNRPFLSGTKRKNPFCYCTNCAYPVQPKRMSNYCPGCGAKMDLEV